ncbi:MAG: hypothetical protein A3D10_08715 [Omnitrophica WOR_2 bacterium RIFCSPHIGHO2_02_FULL_48_11]|nr:MAG: hypothetical protein A3D10_08715 [Omnitrophica WOR_2 bacterium RIFCSPHIGHO2_02_FULL_48_11]
MIKLEGRAIYLSWQSTDHGKRYIVAELIEKSNGQYCFRYIPGKDLDEAKKVGFDGYPAFPNLDEEYTLNAIDPFVMRLPARSRMDFSELLNYWEIQNSNISDFDLLAITGGRLRTDNFEFIDPHAVKRPNQFLTELAGFVYHAEDQELRNIPAGSQMQLERDIGNRHDPYAVKVLYKGKQIGYIKRVHSQTVAEELDKGKKVKAEIKNFDVNGVVNSILLKITIAE